MCVDMLGLTQVSYDLLLTYLHLQSTKGRKAELIARLLESYDAATDDDDGDSSGQVDASHLKLFNLRTRASCVAYLHR